MIYITYSEEPASYWELQIKNTLTCSSCYSLEYSRNLQPSTLPISFSFYFANQKIYCLLPTIVCTFLKFQFRTMMEKAYKLWIQYLFYHQLLIHLHSMFGSNSIENHISDLKDNLRSYRWKHFWYLHSIFLFPYLFLNRPLLLNMPCFIIFNSGVSNIRFTIYRKIFLLLWKVLLMKIIL